MLNPADYKTGGRRRSRGLKTKTLRRMCKSKGLKTTGKKATLMKRLHMRGGVMVEGVEGTTTADKALSAEPEFQPDSSGVAAAPAAVDAAAPAAPADSAGAGRRRRRSRRREGGGKRRHSRRKVTEVALGH